jgi:hypothetical protein
MLRRLEVVGETSVLCESHVLSLDSRQCREIVMALSNYNKNAQEQFMAASAMAMLRLGMTEDDIRSFLETVLKMSSNICKDNPFPCQCTNPNKNTKMIDGIFDRNYYEVSVRRPLPM